jgi:citrate lyase beta subunit
MTKLPLFAIIETAPGIMNLKEIAQAAPQLVGLLFGAEDLTADLGAAPSPDKRELFYARSAVVTAAAAYGLQAIDTVYTDLHNLDGLAAEAQSARQMGYTGKMAVHPNQVSTIQQIFSPTEAEIAQAQAIVTAYQAHLATGEGVFVWNGRMVDKPIVRAAEQVLARARSAHLLDE